MYLITYEFQLNLASVRVFLLSPRPRRGEGLGEGKLNNSLLQNFLLFFKEIKRTRNREPYSYSPHPTLSPAWGEGLKHLQYD